MKLICKWLKAFQVFLGTVVLLVAFDMLVLGGKIKLWIIAVANTTSASPFSSDGQMNWILILVILNLIGIIGLISYVLRGRDIKMNWIGVLIMIFIISLVLLAFIP